MTTTTLTGIAKIFSFDSVNNKAQKRSTIGMSFILMMLTVVNSPAFSQTFSSSQSSLQSSQTGKRTQSLLNSQSADRSLMTSSWERPVLKNFKVVDDPFGNPEVGIVPECGVNGFFTGANNGENNETVVIHFKNVSSTLDINYMNNARMLAIIDHTFSDESLVEQIDYITVTGAASPDGFTDRNEKMAAERALAIKNYIAWRHPNVKRNQVITLSAGEDWDGLRQMIENDFSTPARNEALKIINSTQTSDAKRKQLQQLSSGKTYKYLSENMFPYLRGGAACMLYLKKDAAPQTAARTKQETTFPATAKRESSVWENEQETTFPATAKRESSRNQYDDDNETTFSATNTTERESGNGRFLEREVEIEREKLTVREYGDSRAPVQSSNLYNYPSTNKRNTNDYSPANNKRNTSASSDAFKQRQTPTSVGQRTEKTVLALKTNLLFDVVSAVNFELEVPLDKSWSLAGEYTFPWWLSENRQYCFQLISGNIELRHWLGYREHRPQLTGWYAGMFFGGGYFDFEFGDKGYQGEMTFSTGFSAGYSHEISDNGRWRMEYSLGLGYGNIKYREYRPKIGLDNEWHLIRTGSRGVAYVGPLRAKISLVWTLKR